MSNWLTLAVVEMLLPSAVLAASPSFPTYEGFPEGKEYGYAYPPEEVILAGAVAHGEQEANRNPFASMAGSF